MTGIISRAAHHLRGQKPFIVPFTSAQRTSFYKHTTDRWLYNEDLQNSCRYVEFDVAELQRVACNAVRARRCTDFTKLGEGSYNKVFALKFDNGCEAIARIPSKLVRPPFHATASEVATLEFTREVLGISTPRVFAWNGSADSNSVGAEYIIMEKMPGVELYKRWLDVSGKDAMPIFRGMLELATSFERAPFTSIGSLFFKDDVSPGLQSVPLFDDHSIKNSDSHVSQKIALASRKYRIGPIMDRQWWRRERLGMTADRGPWPDFSSYLCGAINLERSWIAKYAVQNDTPFHRRAPYYDPSAHLRILDMFMQVIPHIIPPPHLCTPTLWHPDLSLANVLVAPSGPADIVGFIDWQDSIVSPYCMQAQFPPIFVYEGDRIFIPPGPSVPKLPDEFSTFLPEERKLYEIELELAYRQKLYEMYIRENKRRLAACSFPLGLQFEMLPYHLVRSWSDSPVALRQVLLDIINVWDQVATPGTPCPISFSDQEIQDHQVEHHRNQTYERAVQALNVELGCKGDGSVPSEQYAASMDKLRIMRSSWNEDENCGPFPYCDGMFSFFLN